MDNHSRDLPGRIAEVRYVRLKFDWLVNQRCAEMSYLAEQLRYVVVLLPAYLSVHRCGVSDILSEFAVVCFAKR